jgi:citrate synthase
MGDEWLVSGIGTSDAESITVSGRDLASELMGVVSFPDLAFLLVAHRLPTPGESSVLNAVLVSLADHGLTPTALAARLTYTGAPEALQAAVAAGLLGAGSVFLGPTEDTALFLAAAVRQVGLDADSPDGEVRVAAERAVRDRIAAGQRVPGLGHPVHKAGDPRVPRLYQLAGDAGVIGPHLRLLRAVAEVYPEVAGRTLPINGAGAAGAALADLGLPPEVARGFALLARTAGLVGHIAEERRQPIGRRLYEDVEHRMTYRPPAR